MGEAGYKKLIAWQKANELAKNVYLVTKVFPRDEMYGLISQMRRAALSVPVNIVEGNTRKGSKELKNFISIALGSLAETEYLLSFSNELGYLNGEDYKKLQSLRREVGGLLWNLFIKL